MLTAGRRAHDHAQRAHLLAEQAGRARPRRAGAGRASARSPTPTAPIAASCRRCAARTSASPSTSGTTGTAATSTASWARATSSRTASAPRPRLHEMFRNSDLFFMANYAQTVNVIGAIKTTKTAAEMEPTGLVLALYRKRFGATPVRGHRRPCPARRGRGVHRRRTRPHRGRRESDYGDASRTPRSSGRATHRRRPPLRADWPRPLGLQRARPASRSHGGGDLDRRCERGGRGTPAQRGALSFRSGIDGGLGASHRHQGSAAIGSRSPPPTTAWPGPGPIRRYEWFQNLWRERRSEWAQQIAQDQSAVVFLGDSITQGWGGGLGAAFPGVKVANRGISGDTTRGVLIRLQDDVLAARPRGGRAAHRHQRPRGRRHARSDRRQRQADPGRPQAAQPAACRSSCARCSRARPRRSGPPIRSRRVNALYRAAVKNDPQVTFLDTWPLFADADGDANAGEFPGPAAPERSRLRQVGGGARPLFATLGFVETDRRSSRPRKASRACSTAATSPAGAIGPTSEADKASAAAMAGLGSQRRRLADRRASRSRFDGLTVDARRPLRAIKRPARGHDAAGVPQDPAALDDARVSPRTSR